MATRRLEGWRRQVQALRDRLKGDQHCTRCGALPNERGVLVVQLDALEALPRDEAGALVEPVFCPGCLQPPRILLPHNGR
jgi:hypothetical protein